MGWLFGSAGIFALLRTVVSGWSIDLSRKAFEKTANIALNYEIGARREGDVIAIYADYTKAKEKLGWVPEHDLLSLVKDMMQSDIKLMQKDQYLKDGGYTMLNYF